MWNMSSGTLLLGNHAIALALLDAGCRVVTGYPGTPSTEVLEYLIDRDASEAPPIHAGWATNEKVAFEEALAASMCGLRAACVMKQVGLNVAIGRAHETAEIGHADDRLLANALHECLAQPGVALNLDRSAI